MSVRAIVKCYLKCYYCNNTSAYFTQKRGNMNTNANQTENNKNRKRTPKQIIALVGVILLALLYVTTFVLAFVDNSASGKLFMTSFVATALLPMVLWIYTWIFGKMTGKKTIADFQLEETTDSAEDSQ